MSLCRMLLRTCQKLGRYVAYTPKVLVKLTYNKVDISIVRRPPSRGSAQPQNSLSSYPVIAPSVKGARESVHIHRVSSYFTL